MVQYKDYSGGQGMSDPQDVGSKDGVGAGAAE